MQPLSEQPNNSAARGACDRLFPRLLPKRTFLRNKPQFHQQQQRVVDQTKLARQLVFQVLITQQKSTPFSRTAFGRFPLAWESHHQLSRPARAFDGSKEKRCHFPSYRHSPDPNGRIKQFFKSAMSTDGLPLANMANFPPIPKAYDALVES